MDVVRIKRLSLPRYVAIARGIDQFITAFLYFFAGLFLKGQAFDRILVYSPPLPLGLTAFGLRRIKKAPVIFNVQDLFPQSAIDLGILNNKTLIKLLERLESFIYRHADFVTVHSRGNRDHVLSKGTDPRRVSIVPNWIDTETVVPRDRDREFREECGLGDGFIISFAGVIGYSQDLDTVIESARIVRDGNILFLIVGDGVEKSRLEEKVRGYGLGNVRFLPMLPKDQYLRLLAASDACLVNLHREVKTPVVPSKLLSIMSAGRAVAASMPLSGDAPRIIEESGCGICVDAGDFRGLAGAVKKIADDAQLREAFASNGRKYAEESFSLEFCASMYEKLK